MLTSAAPLTYWACPPMREGVWLESDIVEFRLVGSVVWWLSSLVVEMCVRISGLGRVCLSSVHVFTILLKLQSPSIT